MFGGINKRQMKKMMQQMGIESEEIEAEEVIIRCKEKEIVFQNPAVTKILVGGKETFQIIGERTERRKEKFSDEDVKIIMEQTGCSEEKARSVLEEEGDIAKAILKLKKQD